MRSIIIFILAAALWAPYYTWGVKSIALIESGKWLSAFLVIALTTIFGFVGLYLVQKFLFSDYNLSTANFRLILITSTQMMAVVLIAIDSKFNWFAIVAGLLIMAGAIIGSMALR